MGDYVKAIEVLEREIKNCEEKMNHDLSNAYVKFGESECGEMSRINVVNHYQPIIESCRLGVEVLRSIEEDSDGQCRADCPREGNSDKQLDGSGESTPYYGGEGLEP